LNSKFDQLKSDLFSRDFVTVSAAIVRSALLLEWDSLGFLDDTSAQVFSQTDIFEKPPSNHEVHAIITYLGQKLDELAPDDKLNRSVIWALGRSQKAEAGLTIIDFLNRSSKLRLVCETTDALRIIADSLENSHLIEMAKNDLISLVSKLNELCFTDVWDETHRRKIIHYCP
jgi:hypothetical protein